MGWVNEITGDYDGGDPIGPEWKQVPDRAPNLVPQSVTPLQARRALKAAGLLDAVNTAAAPGTDAELAWFFANSVERNSDFVKSLAASLGLTDQQVDTLFISAAGFL